MQDKSIYEDVSSPTVSTAATFLVAAIAAQEHRHVATLDIGGAYLNASMKEHEALMRLDPKLAMILKKIRPDYKQFLDKDAPWWCSWTKPCMGAWRARVSGTTTCARR